MRTSLMAAATAAAILSTPMAMTADENPQFQNGLHSTTVIKGTAGEPQEQGTPLAIKTTRIGFQPGTGARRRAAIAALFLIGAAAPCVRAEGKVLLASGAC